MKFIKDSEGDLINLELVTIIQFRTDAVDITFVDGACSGYSLNKKAEVSERVRHEDFIKKLKQLEE